jgi:hypothetical protein
MLLEENKYRDFIKILEWDESAWLVCTIGWSEQLKRLIRDKLNSGHGEFEEIKQRICTFLPDDTMIITTNKTAIKRYIE